MTTCEHTEHGLRRSGNVWGRYWDSKAHRGVWEVCYAETVAWKDQEGICDQRWLGSPEPEREDLRGISY